MSCVLEMGLGLDPVEEIESTLPVIAVGVEGFVDCGGIEIRVGL